MRKTLILGTLVVAGALILLWLTASNIWFSSKPNYTIRNAVAGVHPGQIAAIRFDIPPDFLIITSTDSPIPRGIKYQPGFQYTKRKNPRAVAILLEGLQKAASPPECYMDKINSVQLILKNGKTVGPFIFGNHRFVDCFSPEFIEGMKEAGVKSLPHR